MRHSDTSARLSSAAKACRILTNTLVLLGLVSGCGQDQPGSGGPASGAGTGTGGSGGSGGSVSWASSGTSGATSVGGGTAETGGVSGRGGMGSGGSGAGGSASRTTSGGNGGGSGGSGAGGIQGGGGTGGAAGGGGNTADAAADATGDQRSEADGARTNDAVAPPDAAPGDAGPGAAQLVGRFDHMDSTPAAFDWSGSAIIARFNGTGASLRMDGSPNQFAVLIDGIMSTTVLKVTGSSSTYQVASGLAAGTHDLVIWKRTEGNWGSNNFRGVDITGGQLVSAPAHPGRRVEIYGDSISAGYGLDGQYPCTASQDNQNHYLTYGAVAARTLAAELHTTAWSGIGMYRNYGEDGPSAGAMPAVYDRILASSASSASNAWNFASWQPDAVVINLGTNDFSSKGDPGTPYDTAYLSFVRNLRQKYANAFIVASIGPMLDGANLDAARKHLQAVITTRAGEGDSKMSYLEFPTQSSSDGLGCDYHPSATTNAKMATLLVAELQKQLSW